MPTQLPTIEYLFMPELPLCPTVVVLTAIQGQMQLEKGPPCTVHNRVPGLNARSWGASTPMKMCIQADLDTTGALRHMNKNISERSVCSTHPLAPTSTSFLFVFDTELVMSTYEHQGRDIVL